MTSQLALLVASDSASVFGGIIGFILWIAVMVWVYNLAKRKGRHPILWTILAFFFWLLALVLLLLLPSKRTTASY
jgi:cbb3-type cytochrome oxidase subunit 3